MAIAGAAMAILDAELIAAGLFGGALVLAVMRRRGDLRERLARAKDEILRRAKPPRTGSEPQPT